MLIWGKIFLLFEEFIQQKLLSFRRAQEAHSVALKRITYLESEYNDVVPKKEFDELQARLKTAETEIENLKARCHSLDSQLT